MNILIIKLEAMGDVLRTTSVLKGLKEKYDGPNIYWVTKKESFDLLKNDNLINNIFILDDNINKLINDLKKIEYDLVVSLDEDDEACRLASEVSKRELIGAYLKDNKKTYTENSAEWFDMGLISRYGKEKADKLKKLNKKTYQEIISSMLKIKPSEPILNLDKENIDFANNFLLKNELNKDDLIIGLNTGAGKRWPLKSLSINKTADLANRLMKELKAKILLFGGPLEGKRNKGVIKKSPKIIDAGCNNTLLDFAALVNLCNIVICSDSLAMHIAIALKKNVVAFFAPTSAAEIELYRRGIKIIADSDCYCCYKKEISKKENCIDTIRIESLFDAVKKRI